MLPASYQCFSDLLTGQATLHLQGCGGAQSRRLPGPRSHPAAGDGAHTAVRGPPLPRHPGRPGPVPGANGAFGSAAVMTTLDNAGDLLHNPGGRIVRNISRTSASAGGFLPVIMQAGPRLVMPTPMLMLTLVLVLLSTKSAITHARAVDGVASGQCCTTLPWNCSSLSWSLHCCAAPAWHRAPGASAHPPAPAAAHPGALHGRRRRAGTQRSDCRVSLQHRYWVSGRYDARPAM